MAARRPRSIPELEPAVRDALEAFFGSHAALELSPLAAGNSARGVFKVGASGKNYVLRLGNACFDAHAWADEIRYSRLAAEAGVAPLLHLTRPELGLVLMDWLESAPIADAMAALATSMAALHRCQGHPRGMNLIAWLDEQQRAALAELRGGPVREALLRWESLRAMTQRDATSAPCHQEPNPENIRFAGGKAWLIDWESAGAGDPLYDLASVANWFLWDGAMLDRFLMLYFGRSATRQELAHTRQLRLVHFLFLLLASLRDAGWVEGEAAPPLTWATYLLQPGLGARWHDRNTVAQRQATLAHEILEWRR